MHRTTPPPTPRRLCDVADDKVRNWWTSDDPTDRARAAALCAGCPVRRACATDAIAGRVTAGVWGGVDYTVNECAHVGDFNRVAGRRHRNAARVEDVAFLVDQGNDAAAVAERVGLQVDSLYQLLRRQGREDLWTRLTGLAVSARSGAA